MMDMNNHGVLNIYKEAGPTSHTVVAQVRRILGLKAGHTGTLDPAAEGVLPVCVGRATKLAGYLTAQDKSYTAELHLGFTTDTDDITGQVLGKLPPHVPLPSIEEIRAAARFFLGEIYQVPPMFSAIKKEGKRLYELAREGKTIAREPRKVTIFRLEAAESLYNSRILLYIDCSKGTYIRSLCRDIGEKLGCGGTMGKLVRTRSGNFSFDDAVSLNDISAQELSAKIIPPEEAYPAPRYILTNDDFLKLAQNGAAVPYSKIQPVTLCNRLNSENHCWLYTPQEKLIGLYKLHEESLRPEVMFYENS